MMVSREPRASNARWHARTLRQRQPSVRGRGLTTLLLCALLLWGVGPGHVPGQEQKHKVPGLSKLASGPNQQAFDGIVQSLDMKRKILNVNTVQGQATEFFPIQKNVGVITANGDRRELTALKPGTNVLIIYEQKGDRRTVKQIMIVAAPPKAAKKAAPPS